MNNNEKCLYGIGLGPGDPELITLKAYHLLQKCEVLFYPDGARALSILQGILSEEELLQKKLMEVHISMVKDSINIESEYSGLVDIISEYLNTYNTVAYLTIGDPTIYSSFTPIQKRIHNRGYKTKIINGIPSFLAVAAACDQTLVYHSESLIINPVSDPTDNNFVLIEESLTSNNSTCIYMKQGKEIPSLLSKLSKEAKKNPLNIFGATNCCLEDEILYRSLEELQKEKPDNYFTTIISKNV